MAFYRKKPVVIEAHQVNALDIDGFEGVSKWCGGRVVFGPRSYMTDAIEIRTLEGVMRATDGDYIIKGVQGEFYPCKPDIFHATYESTTQSVPS